MSTVVVLFILFFVLKGNKDFVKSDIFRIIGGVFVLFLLMSALFSLPVFPIAVIALIIYLATRAGKRSGTNRQEAENKRRYEAGQSGSFQYNEEQMKNRYKGQTRAAMDQMSRRAQEQRERQSAVETTSYTSYQSTSAKKVSSRILPRAVKKREKIVATFNEQYHLCLTEDEQKRMVEASYLSEGWKRELEAMSERYDAAQQWLMGPTCWLRVYMYVFCVQTISSDFQRQEAICMETFDEVMRYAESLTELTLEEKITRVNDRFFSSFTETSFMMAYRYMQSKGKTYQLEQVEVMKNETEVEQIMSKYQ